jgi:glutathione S-transferase
MKLYYSPGACSLSPHIALHEAGLQHELVKVDLRAKKLENGDDYLKINPKGQVPALMLDNGELVTEGPVIVQMIADKAAAKNLAPAATSPERYKLQEWLTYINGELHKNIGPLFNPALSDDAKGVFKDRAGQVQICRRAARRQGLPDGQAVHGRRRLYVRDADMGGADEVRPLRPVQPESLPGPHRRAPWRAGRAENGSAAEGGVRSRRVNGRAGHRFGPSCHAAPVPG